MPLRSWYRSGKMNLHPITLIWRKWISQPGRVKRPVPHDLVRRMIRSWIIWSSAQDLNLCTERWVQKIWMLLPGSEHTPRLDRAGDIESYSRTREFIQYRGFGSEIALYLLCHRGKNFLADSTARGCCVRGFFLTQIKAPCDHQTQHHSKREIAVGCNLNIFKYSQQSGKAAILSTVTTCFTPKVSDSPIPSRKG